MTSRPLAHRRFLITRPESQSDRLATLLEEAGAVALLAPMIDIGPAADPAALADALRRLPEFDLAVFVSPSALDAVAAQVPVWPAQVQAAVIGPGSRDRAAAIGIHDLICPASQFDSEGLLAEPALQDLHGKQVILFRGNGGRELLAQTLTARGARLEAVEAYQRLQPRFSDRQLQDLLAEGCDGVIVTSSEAAHNLFSLVAFDGANEPLAESLRALLFFCSHPRIGEAVRQHGVRQVHLTTAGDASILAALIECFSDSAPTGESATSFRPERAASKAKPDSTADRGPDRGSKNKRRRFPRHVVWAAGAGVVAIVVSMLVQQGQMNRLRADWQDQLKKATAPAEELAGQVERQAGHARQLDGRVLSLEQRNDEFKAQQTVLQQQFSTLAGDQEAGLLADAELTLSLASQQLQLTGNVSAALAALYRLDERLAGFNKPMLAHLRRALARDIDALKRTPYLDRVGISTRIDSLASTVDQLPLRVDAKAADDSPAADARDDAKGLYRVIRTVGAALGAFVQIRRMDRPDPVLLAPEQALYLREHIKLRLLNARLALLQHEENTYRRDLTAAETEIGRHFDARAKPVVATLATLKELLVLRPNLELTDLSVSIAAARDARRSAGKANPS